MWGGIIIMYISFTPIKGDHGPLCILAIPVNSGAARDGPMGAKARERSDREGGGCGREIFWKFVYENEISCTLNDIIRGLVIWSDIYMYIPIPYTPPFFWKIILLQSRGAGAWPFVPLDMPVDGGAARICQRGAIWSEGAKRPSGGGCGRGFPPPTVGRFFKICVLKTAFSCTLDTFSRGI